MNVLVVEPGMAPYEKEINGLSEMQAVVGGNITVSYPFEFSKFLSEMAEKGEISEENYLKICRKNAERLFGI